MNRNDFLRIVIRYLLLVIMAIIVIALGGKVVTGKDCAGCPGNGICKGKTDCEKY
jgi:hypothetical protein